MTDWLRLECPACGGPMNRKSVQCQRCRVIANGSPHRVAVEGEAALVDQYAGYAITVALSLGWRIPGLTDDDIKQEALVGLRVAIRSFDPSHGGQLKSFISLVVKRHIITVLAMARREKHTVLNESVREALNDEYEVVSIIDLLPDLDADPAERIERAESIARVRAAVGELSELERDSLGRVVHGVPYQGEKRIDNAIRRARKKLREAA